MILLTANSSLITSIITPLAICILVPLVMTGVAAWHRKVVDRQNKSLNHLAFKVRYNSLVIGILIFLVVFLFLVTMLFPVLYLCDIPDGPPIEVVVGTAVGFGLLTILSGIFLYVVRRWEIGVSEDGIKFVPHFGKSKEYQWQDISRVKCTVAYSIAYYQVYIRQKTRVAFRFSAVMVGGAQFAEMLQNKGLIFGNYLL